MRSPFPLYHYWVDILTRGADTSPLLSFSSVLVEFIAAHAIDSHSSTHRAFGRRNDQIRNVLILTNGVWQINVVWVVWSLRTDRLTCWLAGSVPPKTNRLTRPGPAALTYHTVCHDWGLNLSEGGQRGVIGWLPSSFSTVIGIPVLIRTSANRS